jgi:hypothetical protein
LEPAGTITSHLLCVASLVPAARAPMAHARQSTASFPPTNAAAAWLGWTLALSRDGNAFCLSPPAPTSHLKPVKRARHDESVSTQTALHQPARTVKSFSDPQRSRLRFGTSALHTVQRFRCAAGRTEGHNQRMRCKASEPSTKRKNMICERGPIAALTVLCQKLRSFGAACLIE